MAAFCACCKTERAGIVTFVAAAPCCMDCVSAQIANAAIRPSDVEIKEAIPYSFWRLFAGYIALLSAAAFFFATSLSLLLWLGGNQDIRAVIFGPLIFAAVLGAFSSLFALPATIKFVQNRPEITAKDGGIVLEYGDFMAAAQNGSQCQWMSANIMNCNFFVLLGGKALHLIIPRTGMYELVAPVGFTPESKRAWQWFFATYAIAQDEMRPKIIRDCNVGLFLLLLSPVLWYPISQLIRCLLLLLNFHNATAKGIGTLVLLLGCLASIFIFLFWAGPKVSALGRDNAVSANECSPEQGCAAGDSDRLEPPGERQ